jgi:hypothetical protein
MSMFTIFNLIILFISFVQIGINNGRVNIALPLLLF